MEKAIFGAGCFWGVEEAFRKVKGVKETTVGYMGGTLEDPTYEDVCTNTTGHAEVVQIVYDPKQVSYEELLNKFWEIHDPTQVNRQGFDVGSQYKSIIFYHNEEQKRIAEKSKHALEKSGKYSKPIATEITEVKTFYKAEEYHQKYFLKNKRVG
ncbi:MAG TPA: peptide-methionine (S)-S-oxide reductase [Bacteroidetes bacterium]|nr:peptide-methionine (S)-S-oxide reductase [Bacteroidota bacterium]